MAERGKWLKNPTAIFRQMLPELLKKLSRIKDPRQPQKIKHKIRTLMAYGILFFVYQTGSRRDANKKMSKPIFWDNVRAMFPELESLPHADTLARLLERIDVEEIQNCLVELLQDLIRRKKFRNQLINKRYLIAVDGSQKFFRNYQWEPEALGRYVGGEERIPQFYVYVLESVLVLDNGIVLPILTETLENNDGQEGRRNRMREKAFGRLAKKLYRFSERESKLIANGLYAVVLYKKCKEYHGNI